MSLRQSPGGATLNVAGGSKPVVCHPDARVIAGDVHGGCALRCRDTPLLAFTASQEAGKRGLWPH
jgi:hypothetical protein